VNTVRPIQRYDNDDYGAMSEFSLGDWVKYEDHLQDREALVRALEEIEGGGCACRGDDHEDGCAVAIARVALRSEP
jgi:hypothetical protein